MEGAHKAVRLNAKSLLVHIRKLLARSDTKVVERRLKHCGQSRFLMDDDLGPSEIQIFIDPRRDGRVRVVIHELLHVWFADHFKLDRRLVYALEEPVICALEEQLYSLLGHDALESWNKAIKRKMR